MQGPSKTVAVGRLAAGAAAALLLAGCATDAGPSHPEAKIPPPSTTMVPPPSTTMAQSPTVPSTLPVPPIAWTPCNGDLQCGTLTVPLDYAQPQGATIGIALERHVANDPAQRIGSLVINPGGPGVSGIDDFPNELSSLTGPLLDDFDVVTFDPRGVQRSAPVSCGETPGAPPPALSDPVPQSVAAQKTTIDSMRNFGSDCEKASGAVLPFVGTVDVARDLERLRIALGDPGLTFMGQSYGTLIGETYATLFPTHVRAIVLDSVIDPALSYTAFTSDQAQSFEGDLGSFFAWCAANSTCPWRTTSDPTAAVLALLAQSRTAPAPAGGGRTAGPGEMYNALLEGLYSETDWPTLGVALAADAQGNGAPIVAMSDQYVADGSTNGSDAAEAIYCLDHPVSKNVHSYTTLAAQLGATAPVFGPFLAWSQAACAVWPAAPTRRPAAVRAPGAPPILVVGTTGDPATPYAWAASVAHQLGRGVLLTRDGNDHVAYFYSACVRGYVETYLLGGGAPPSGTVCAA